jgi:pimeloyl-ACP methyl ester carboxylesterase
MGSSEGGSVCILFAASYPERVLSLVLYGTAARFSRARSRSCSTTRWPTSRACGRCSASFDARPGDRLVAFEAVEALTATN